MAIIRVECASPFCSIWSAFVVDTELGCTRQMAATMSRRDGDMRVTPVDVCVSSQPSGRRVIRPVSTA